MRVGLHKLRLVLGVGVLATALLSVSPASSSITTEFVAEADTYVTALHPRGNRGDLLELKADLNPQRTIFLRFNVAGVTPRSSVVLKVWVEKKTRHGLDVRTLSSDWDEHTVTYQNAPDPGYVVARTGPVLGQAWATADVSSYVQSDGVVSLAVTTENPNSVTIFSREAAEQIRPRLVVTSEEPEPEPEPLSPFTVSIDGAQYRASSAAGAAYTGSLKSVVESAAADLAADGGGVVKFSAGSFDLGLDSFRFIGLSGVEFEGAGMDSTSIRNSNNGALDTEIFDFSRASGIAIRDMTLSANGAARTTSDTIDVDGGSENVIERIRISSSRGRGIVFDGKDAPGGSALSAESNAIRDCVIGGVPMDGIQLLAASHNTIERCTITNAGRHGISIAKSSATADQPNKKPVANVLSANLIQGSGDDGINLTSGDQNELLGNIVVNSASTVALGDGIKLATADGISCDDNVVAGNSLSDTREIKRQRYGVNISDPLCARTVMRDNTFSGNRLGPINDAGTDTIFAVSRDTQPPSVPGGVAAVATDAERVDVSWEVATDDVGIAGYTIYRDGAPVATVPATSRTYADTSVSGGTTYSYTVDAFDAAGNHSAESGAAPVTTPPGATIVTFAASADAYVNAELVDSSFGTADILRTDGDPILRSYLRFDVAGITGTPSKVTLRIFANSASTGGFEVRSISGSWDETVTFATSPEPGDVLRSSGAFQSGRYVEVDITAAVTGNGTYDFVLTGGDSTAAAYASRETGTPPQLVVEYSG